MFRQLIDFVNINTRCMFTKNSITVEPHITASHRMTFDKQLCWLRKNIWFSINIQFGKNIKFEQNIFYKNIFLAKIFVNGNIGFGRYISTGWHLTSGWFSVKADSSSSAVAMVTQLITNSTYNTSNTSRLLDHTNSESLRTKFELASSRYEPECV